MNGRELAAALHSGKRVYGTCVVSTSNLWPNVIAGTGADFVFIDTEHTPIGREHLSVMCRAFRERNVAPIVRISECNPDLATAVLDGGANGVVAPYMETVEQVKALRGATKLRPIKGQRLQRVLDGEEEFDEELANYIKKRNADNILVVNVESVPAIEALDDILAVPGVDAVLVGPHDLSCSLGVPEQWRHPVFKEAMTTIITTSRKHNVGVGMHISYGIEDEIEWARAGANFIVHSSDLSLVQETLQRDFAKFRSDLDGEAAAGEGEAIII
jgi:staphyloferrin B biosynthesis citrate synthase